MKYCVKVIEENLKEREKKSLQKASAKAKIGKEKRIITQTNLKTLTIFLLMGM